MKIEILTFEKFLLESEEEKLDEGWKEIIIAGAMSLAALRGAAQQPGSEKILKEPQRVEYVKKQENDKKIITATVTFGNEFKSGSYKFDKDKLDNLQEKLAEIGNFIKEHQNCDMIITINTGESLVPNRDRETRKSLNTGDLAKKRANVTKDVIEIFLGTLKDKGILNGRYVIDTSTVIGKTPYKPGEDVNQEKFTKEQFVDVKLEIKDNVQNIKTEDFSAYAIRGERFFRSSNRHGFGDIFYVTRVTDKIKEPGYQDVGHQNVLLRTLAKDSEFAKTKNPYDGNTYLIPWKWLNKATNYTTFSDEQIEYIKSNFEIK